MTESVDVSRPLGSNSEECADEKPKHVSGNERIECERAPPGVITRYGRVCKRPERFM